jgi:hypothetical protein
VAAALNQSPRDLAASLRAVLGAAQEERDARPDLVAVDGEMLCEWAVYERSVMLREVNWVRTDAGLPEVPLEAIVRVEQSACGHSDYTQKFAFYCAELALDCSPIWMPAKET